MKVERNFWQVWFGKPMPKKYRKYRKTWIKHHPDWTFHLITEKNLKKYDFIDLDILDLCNNHSERSDVIRWNSVYHCGGIYIDLDFRNFKPLDPLIEDLDCFISSENNYHLCGGFFGATKGHPLIKRLVDLIEPTLRATMNNTSDHRIGPLWVSNNISWDEITVLPREYFYPYLPGDQFGKDTFRSKGIAYAEHVWNGSWLRNPKQKLVIKSLALAILCVPFLRSFDLFEFLF